MSQSRAYLKMMLAQSIINNDPNNHCLKIAGAFIDKKNNIEYRHSTPIFITKLIKRILYKSVWFDL